jgi:hypothetical protein
MAIADAKNACTAITWKILGCMAVDNIDSKPRLSHKWKTIEKRSIRNRGECLLAVLAYFRVSSFVTWAKIRVESRLDAASSARDSLDSCTKDWLGLKFQCQSYDGIGFARFSP